MTRVFSKDVASFILTGIVAARCPHTTGNGPSKQAYEIDSAVPLHTNNLLLLRKSNQTDPSASPWVGHRKKKEKCAKSGKFAHN